MRIFVSHLMLQANLRLLLAPMRRSPTIPARIMIHSVVSLIYTVRTALAHAVLVLMALRSMHQAAPGRIDLLHFLIKATRWMLLCHFSLLPIARIVWPGHIAKHTHELKPPLSF